ncbi:MAG: hypothetical protein L0228_01845 [Planctomycetes bacterium]|nr:hypothetical protein [Planctomycetota bacterium]
MASQMMPQFVSPSAAFAAPSACSSCQPAMMAQPAYYAEPSCGYVETGCGMPYGNVVAYGPMMDCGPCGCEGGMCSGGFSDGGVLSAPAPEQFVDPRPSGE